jgi:hypothetical protein
VHHRAPLIIAPSPLVGEGSSAGGRERIWVRGLSPRENLSHHSPDVFADRDPSSVADWRPRHLLPQGEKEENTRHPSRGAFRPGFTSRFRPHRIEGAGKTGCPHAPMGFRAKDCAKARSHRYRRSHTGLPCAVVYGLYALSWVNLADCHPRQPRRASILGLTWRQPLGRQDHTISLVRG